MVVLKLDELSLASVHVTDGRQNKEASETIANASFFTM